MDHHPFIQCAENLAKAVLATRAAEQRIEFLNPSNVNVNGHFVFRCPSNLVFGLRDVNAMEWCTWPSETPPPIIHIQLLLTMLSVTFSCWGDVGLPNYNASFRNVKSGRTNRLAHFQILCVRHVVWRAGFRR